MSDTPAIAAFFLVTIDGMDLGNWSKLSGLGMSLGVTHRTDSALSFMHFHLPGPLTYSDITLERQVNSYTMLTMAWFSTYHMMPVPLTAQIAALDAQANPIMSWDLMGVTPNAWKGPDFDASAAQHGTERLTLSFMGFA
jgi:phage tail-like protein